MKIRKCAEFPRAGCVFRVGARNAAEHYEHFIISYKENDPLKLGYRIVGKNYKLDKIRVKTTYNGNNIYNFDLKISNIQSNPNIKEPRCHSG